jgi:hypothetical protein
LPGIVQAQIRASGEERLERDARDHHHGRLLAQGLLDRVRKQGGVGFKPQ